MLTEWGPHPATLAGGLQCSEGVAADGVLSGEGRAAQHDEDKDEVGEDVVVDELVAAHVADPAGRATAWMNPGRARAPASALSMLGPLCGDGPGRGPLSLCHPSPHPANWNHPDHSFPDTLRVLCGQAPQTIHCIPGGGAAF